MQADEEPRRPWRSLAAAMILQYAVGGAMLPFLTLLLRDRGLSLREISLVLLAGSATLLVSPFFWGMLADRYLRLDRLFAVMNGAAAGSLLVFSQQRTLPGALVAFALFFACYQPTPILVNALALRHVRDPNRDFAPLRAWGSIGWILPSLPIFGWLVLGGTRNLEFVVWLGLLFSLGMVGVSFVLPATPPGAAGRCPTSEPALGYWPGLRRLLANGDYRVLLASYFLVAASFAIQAYYSPPRLEDLGMSRPVIGVVQSAGVVWEIALFYWRAAIIRRLGQAGTVLVGCVALMLRQILFAAADQWWVLAASYLLVGTTVVFYHIGVNLLVEAIAGPQVKATAQSLLTLCSSGLGPIFAHVAVGWFAAEGRGGLGTVFWFSACLAGMALLLLARRRPRPT